MLKEEFVTNKQCYHYNNYVSTNSPKNVFDLILKLANEGKIDSRELNILLSFYAAKLIEREVENKIENFITYDLNKFFRKRFFND